MKGKNLLILVILAAIVLGIAVLSSRTKQAAPPEVVGTALLPKLDVNAVEKIVVRSALGSVTLAKKEDVWVLPSKFNYPANFDKIKGALLKMADVKIGQVVSVDGTQRAELKMEWPSSSTNAPAAGSGTVVALFGTGDVNLGSILIGESRMRKQEGAPADYRGYADGQYISSDGGKSVYLVKETLGDMTADTKAWLDSDLFNAQMSDISTITMVGTNGATVKMSRNKDTSQTTIEGLSDKEETDSGKLSSVQTALAYLKFDDVADPSLSPGAMGLDKPAIFEATTQKGEIYTLKIGGMAPSGDGRYVRIEVAMTETNAAAPKAEVKKDESGKPAATDNSVERLETEKKVRALQDKLGNWTYVVASYKTGAMLTPRSELVKKKEEPKKEEAKKEEAPPVTKVEEPGKEELMQVVSPVVGVTNAPEKKTEETKGSWWKRLWK